MAKKKKAASPSPTAKVTTTTKKKRALRSNTVIPTVVASPPTKRKQTTKPRYLCDTCGVVKTGRSFPDYNPSAECEHLIHTCRVCLRRWIDVCISNHNYRIVDNEAGASTFAIRCPERFQGEPCPAMMRPVNVKAAATKASYAKFARLARRHIEENIPGWRWCLAPACDNGQVHTKDNADVQPLVESPKEKDEDEDEEKRKKKKKRAGGKRGKKVAAASTDAAVPTEKEESKDIPDIFTCNLCGAKACVTCDLPYHEGETCKEFQQRTQNSSNEASLLLIATACKKCPKCTFSIEKNGGCDTMFCTHCLSPFCWRCMQVFKQGNYCRCNSHPAGVPL